MPWEWYPVQAFGGGLNVGTDPLSIQDDQWTACHAVMPEQNQAVTAPAFQVLVHGNQWLRAGSSVGGWVPDLLFGGLLTFGWLTAGNTSGYPITEITNIQYSWGSRTPVISNWFPDISGILTGTPYIDVDSLMPQPMTTSAVAGEQLILTGVPADLTQSGAIKYLGDGSFHAIPSVGAKHGCAAAGHGIVGDITMTTPPSGVPQDRRRTIMVSTGGPDPLGTWAPDITNSADFFLVDGGGPVMGLSPVTGGFVVIQQRGLTVAQSTRQIPPFTVDRMQSRGGLGEGALTPLGVIYMTQAGMSDISGNLRAPQVTPYLIAHATAPEGGQVCNVIYDPANDAATVTNLAVNWIAPVKLGAAPAAWLHRLPFTPSQARKALHGTIQMQQPDLSDSPPQAPRATIHAVMNGDTGDMWAQFDLATPEPDAYVDTKDFAFGAGTQIATVNAPGAMMTYVDRLKVQWESTATGALDVWAAVRNHFSSQGGAVLPWQTDATSNLHWVKVGTLTAGLSELALRLKGKFFRFRFAVSNGQPLRIRGFAIRYLPTADLRKAA